MNIEVTGRQLNISDSLNRYATEKIGNALKVIEADPGIVEVVLHFEKNPSNPRPATCEVTFRVNSHIIRVEEAEEEMHAAIDVAAAKVERQLRKFKTRVYDSKIKANQDVAAARRVEEKLDFDELLADMYAEEDAIVRVKEVEFPPLTEEEALIQIDLLGHDFFAYTDRDSNLVNVLYRRNNGGYGLLKQV